jgi:hypothetical protein
LFYFICKEEEKRKRSANVSTDQRRKKRKNMPLDEGRGEKENVVGKKGRGGKTTSSNRPLSKTARLRAETAARKEAKAAAKLQEAENTKMFKIAKGDDPRATFKRFFTLYKKMCGDDCAHMVGHIYGNSRTGKEQLIKFSNNPDMYVLTKFCIHCVQNASHRPADCPEFMKDNRKKLIRAELQRREKKRRKKVHKVGGLILDTKELYDVVEIFGGFEKCSGDIAVPSTSNWVKVGERMGMIPEEATGPRRRVISAHIKHVYCEKFPEKALEARDEYTDFFRSYHLRRISYANKRRITVGKKSTNHKCKYCGQFSTSHASIHCPLVAHPLLRKKFALKGGEEEEDHGGALESMDFEMDDADRDDAESVVKKTPVSTSFDRLVNSCTYAVTESEKRCIRCNKVGHTLSVCPERYGPPGSRGRKRARKGDATAEGAPSKGKNKTKYKQVV